MESFIYYTSPYEPTGPARICDLCSVRKVKCVGGRPCHGCLRAGVECSNRRVKRKPGPKGPRLYGRSGSKSESRRQNALPELVQYPDYAHNMQKQPLGSSELEDPLLLTNSNPDLELKEPCFHRHVQYLRLVAFIELYHRELFPVYPVVDKKELVTRLRNPDDLEAYALATALSAVTATHSQAKSAFAEERSSSISESLFLTTESEQCRHWLGFQDRDCSLYILLSSFFLHIVSANTGRSQKATLLLREATSFAQLLRYDRAEHYTKQAPLVAQQHLRVYWLLFVTEKGHSTRFDLPTTLKIRPGLPALEAGECPEILGPFINFCNLFHKFDCVTNPDTDERTPDTFRRMHRQLSRMPIAANRASNELQRTNFLITQQWMQLVLWKLSMSHISLNASSQDDCLTFSFPNRIAGEVVAYLNHFSREAIEAHGLGMEMKLCEVGVSLAQVLTCVPIQIVPSTMWHVSPHDVLAQLICFLSSYRSGTGASFEVLRQQVQAGGIFTSSPVQQLTCREPEQTSALPDVGEPDSD